MKPLNYEATKDLFPIIQLWIVTQKFPANEVQQSPSIDVLNILNLNPTGHIKSGRNTKIYLFFTNKFIHKLEMKPIFFRYRGKFFYQVFFDDNRKIFSEKSKTFLIQLIISIYSVKRNNINSELCFSCSH